MTTRWAYFRRPLSGHGIIVLVIALAAFLAGGLVATGAFEQLPHLEDEVAYLFQAKVFALGKIYTPSPQYPHSFFSPFILDHEGQRFGKYPPGHPLLLALGVLAGHPWLVNALSSALTLIIVYHIGCELYDPSVGLMAAALGLSSPFLLLLSGTLMSHPTSLLFLSLFTWLLLRTTHSAARRYPLLAGVALGIAFLIRPLTAASVAFPLILYAVRRVVRGREGDLSRYSWLVIGFLPLAALLPAYFWALTGDPFLTPYELWWPFDRWGFGPGHGKRGFHTPGEGLQNAMINLSALSTHLFGWPAVSLAFVALLFLLGSADRRDALLLSTFGSLVLVHIPYWTSGCIYGPRYYFEALPALLLLTARGLQTVARRLRLWSRLPHLTLIVLVLLNVAIYLPGQWRMYQGWYGITTASLEAMRRADLHNALVFVHTESWTDYAPLFCANSPLLDSDVVYAIDLGDLSNQQVRALYPARNVFFLHGTHLTPIE
ncbi:MAG: glycosyltransferase family 39 protein [Chloroflexota bacterium]|nr:glycosyltransferase family 39 protein [Chloroflexota bacterium]